MMSDGTTPTARSDSVEFDARFQRRLWKFALGTLTLATMAGTPLYCVSQLPTEAKVKEMSPSRVEFARALGRIEAIEKGNRRFERRVEKQFGELKSEVKSGFRELADKIDRIGKRE